MRQAQPSDAVATLVRRSDLLYNRTVPAETAGPGIV
jgi:hypothetical protein